MRLFLNYLIVFKVFFDNHFLRLYKNLINKKIIAFVVAFLLDSILLLFYILLKFNHEEKENQICFIECFLT